MIEIGGVAVSGQDPRLWAAVAVAVAGLLLVLIWRAAARAARAADPLARHLGALGQRVQGLADGQQQLAGGLHHVSEAQIRSQTQMLALMERRLADVSEAVRNQLQGSSTHTARSLGELHQRLQSIDRAQANLEKLSGDVLGLQDILSNKQARGAFGEIQLQEIVTKALPPDAYAFQATLPNGRRADCLIHLPHPPGPLVIDSKFPLEAYEALRAAEGAQAQAEARRGLRTAVRAHLRAIAERYVVEGVTADSALMFLPSEAVYAELHANLGDVVREGFALRVWIVSPTTCMATLHTLRAVLKDLRIRDQAGTIRRELSLLHADLDRLLGRVENLDRHFGMAARDIEEIRLSADKAGRRARRLDRVDFEDAGDGASRPGAGGA